MTAARTLELSPENNMRGGHTFAQANISTNTLDSLPSNFFDCDRLPGVLRIEVSDREAANNDVDAASDPLVDLRLNSASLGPVEHLTANVLCAGLGAKDNGERFTRPRIGIHCFYPRAFHHGITADLADSPNNADRSADTESDYCHDYNHNQKSKHFSTLLRKAGIK